MTKYIPLDDLVAEIEKLKKSHDNWSCMGKCFHQDYETLLSFINTLEVKEVDSKDVKSVFEGQYLDKDKVVTTIERLQDECEEKGDNNGVDLLENLSNKLDTIEAKKVDIDKILYHRRNIGFTYPEGASEYQKRLVCYRQGIEDVLKAQKGK